MAMITEGGPLRNASPAHPWGLVAVLVPVPAPPVVAAPPPADPLPDASEPRFFTLVSAIGCEYRLPVVAETGCGCYRPALCLQGRAWRLNGFVALNDCMECVNSR